MGYYIETGTAHDKAKIICEKHGGELIPQPKDFSEIPEDKALICVVDNGIFEAAAYCFDDREFFAFNDPKDNRPKTWLTMDKKKAVELTK